MEETPKLIPVKVPWQIAPSTPFLRTVVSEGGPVELQFVGWFLNETHESEIEGIDDRQLIETVSSIPTPNPSDISGSYQLVKVVFPHGGWVRVTPAITNRNTMSEVKYDWSGVNPSYLAGDDIDTWMKNVDEEWSHSGFCPYPGMYQIERSDWLNLVTSAQRLQFEHYLLLGSEIVVEILSGTWTWESLGRIAW